jgi:iron complex transport system ATP-binding protein
VTLLVASDLHAWLGGTDILRGITLSIARGEFVGLIGPNGAGKSTLLRTLLGLTLARGTITIDGHDAAAMSARERARHIAYLPQERDVAWDLSVSTLVELGRTPQRSAFGGVSPQDRAAVERAIARMEIEPFRNRIVTTLSGGEKARVLIARALAQEVPLLLADEPTAGLDPAHGIALMRIFRGLARENSAVVASLHDLGLAARWCDRLIMLDGGRVVAQGAPGDVLTPARLRDVYGVEAHFGEAMGGPVILPVDVAARP